MRILEFAIAIAAVLFSSNAFAWILLKDARDPSFLIHAIKERSEIVYCVRSDLPEVFSNESLALQVQTALSIWIDGMPQTTGVKLTQVDCGPIVFSSMEHPKPAKNVDLVVQFSHLQAKNRFKGQTVFWVGAAPQDSYIHLILNADYTANIPDNRGPDLLTLAGVPLDSGARFLTELSKAKMYSTTLEEKLRLPTNSVFNTYYGTILHEIGHTIGLADTYSVGMSGSPANIQGDRELRSPSQPAALMQMSPFFYLAPDDLAGLRTLWDRSN